MDLQAFEVRLRDGTRVLVRPIRGDDKDALQRGLQLLSPQSRYLRFHAPVSELTEAQLRYLTEIDYVNHMAWVAVHPERPDEPGMAVARYVRLPDEPSVAEAAITVADAFQGKGLGSELLTVLGRSAWDNGIRTFRSYVLPENTAMLRVFERLGARTEGSDGGAWRVEIDLPTGPEDAPESPIRRVLRSVARGELPSMPAIDAPYWASRDARERVLKRRDHATR